MPPPVNPQLIYLGGVGETQRERERFYILYFFSHFIFLFTPRLTPSSYYTTIYHYRCIVLHLYRCIIYIYNMDHNVLYTQTEYTRGETENIIYISGVIYYVHLESKLRVKNLCVILTGAMTLAGRPPVVVPPPVIVSCVRFALFALRG